MSVSTDFNGGGSRVQKYQVEPKIFSAGKSFIHPVTIIGASAVANAISYSAPTSYIVNKGETLASIAKKLGVRVEVLYSDNRALIGDNPNNLIAGQELLVRPTTNIEEVQEEVIEEVPISIPVGKTILPEGEEYHYETTPEGVILDTPEYRYAMQRQQEAETKEIDISKYHNLEELGFVVSTGNKTYSLEESDIDLLSAITAAECDKSYDDALAVISVILNRCEASNWVYSHGDNPVSQATAPNQFVVYQEGYYKAYLNGNAPEEVKTAVTDALAGVRNNSYLSFRSNSTKGYSNNQITSSGNRYR